ncbi:MAG: hypothetical protein Aurels2KO_52460 [Aureliella sp.]
MPRSNQAMRPEPSVFDAWLQQEAFHSLASATAGKPHGELLAWQKQYIDEQLRFRSRMRRRFPIEQSWLWTDRSLSQASDWWSASYKASLFPAGVCVLDACCGAGVDSVALAQRGHVVAMDNAAETLAIARANVTGHVGQDCQFEALCGSFPEDIPADVRWMHADPDRRPPDKSASERKTLRADMFMPSLESLLEYADTIEGAAIKIAPSTVFSEECLEKVEESTQRVWLGVFGECRQQLLLSGALRSKETPQRKVVLCHPARAEFAGNVEELASWSEAPASFVYDLHPALFASQLHNAWANQHALTTLGSDLGYFTSDTLVESPFAQSFQVVDTLAWDDRKVRKWLRQNDAGIVDIKNRGLRLDAGHFQRRYSNPDGKQPFSLLVTQLGQRVRAIVCRRIASE